MGMSIGRKAIMTARRPPGNEMILILRLQIIGICLTLAGSGCSMLAPSTHLYWQTLQAPSEDPDFDQLHRSNFDRDAKQLSPEGLKAGLQVQLLMVERQIEKKGQSPEAHFKMTQYLGTVESVNAQTVVLKDAIQIIEGGATRGVPIVSKVPYFSRMFRSTGVGRESRKMPDDVTIPRNKIGGAFELSASGAETLMFLQQVERIGVDYEED